MLCDTCCHSLLSIPDTNGWPGAIDGGSAQFIFFQIDITRKKSSKWDRDRGG
jgi:hypothetical protein